MQKRWGRILFPLIDEYIDSGAPVGSKVLVKKYDLGVSPATVRNVMARLTDEGYLAQPHTSAGRIPLSKAYRVYVNEYAEERALPINLREDVRKYLREQQQVRDFLRYYLEMVSDAITQVGLLQYAGFIDLVGLANMLRYEEFEDRPRAYRILSFLEKKRAVQALIQLAGEGLDNYQFFIGEDLSILELQDCAVAFARYQVLDSSILVGFLGPTRMDYNKTIGAFRYLNQILNDELEI